MTKRIQYVKWIPAQGTHAERMARVQTDPARHHAYHSELVVCDAEGVPLKTTHNASGDTASLDADKPNTSPGALR